MRSRPWRRSAILLTVFLWVAATNQAWSSQAQVSEQSGRAPSSAAEDPGSPSTSNETPAQSSVWHHFGENQNAPAARQAESSGWRRFSATGAGRTTGPSRLSPSQFSASRAAELERQLFGLVNRDRLNPANAAETRSRALPLRWNEKLAAVARAHSEDMLRRGYFDHASPEGGSPRTRIEAAGIRWQGLAENIAIDGGVPSAEAAFMNEPRFGHNHRANILNPKYTDVGIGIVQGPDGQYYVTQDFIEAPTSSPGPIAGAIVGSETHHASPSR